VLLSSFIGDSIILISSVRYNAIKLNKLIVVVMQHIAVCDILAAICFVLPTLTSLIANKWILGEVVAYIHIFFDTCTSNANNILICSLVTIKLIILKFPLRTRNWNKYCAHVACACIWLLAILLPVLRLIFVKDGLVFSFIHYNINYGIPSEYFLEDKVISYVMAVLGNYVPTLIILSATICITIYLVKSRRAAKKSGGDKRWHGIVTVVLTATVYCITTLPHISLFVISISNKVSEKDTRVNLERFLESLVTLNIMCNFFIYSLTIPSLREFLKSKASQISMRLTRCPELFRGNQEENSRDQRQIEEDIPNQQDNRV
jgi:hypothetical protein